LEACCARDLAEESRTGSEYGHCTTDRRNAPVGAFPEVAMTKREEREHKEHVEHEAEAGAAGALIGAVLGSIAGPPGAAVGAILGAAAGALTGSVIDSNKVAAATEDAKLDEEIGVTSSEIGAPNLEHPPAKIGAFSGASSGGASGGEGEPSAEGPFLVPPS
jgi:phage tail tape-measure protein